jgi:hypothetical protein
MLNLPERIAELAGSLGTSSGLKRVNLEIDLLNARLTEEGVLLSEEELVKLRGALASLSGAIGDMSRVARTILSEAGVKADYVG